MARKIPAWTGKTDDVAIPSEVKLRIWSRAKGHCQICTRLIMAGEVKHFDHVTPLADGGKHSETNLQIACVACHAEKTAGEATDRAQVRAVAKSVLGLKPKPKAKIPSPPKQPKPVTKAMPPRRNLYEATGTAKILRRDYDLLRDEALEVVKPFRDDAIQKGKFALIAEVAAQRFYEKHKGRAG